MDSSDPGTIALRLAAVVALVLANAFFVAAEFAFVGTRKTRLDEMVKTGRRTAIVARGIIRQLDRYISATQLGITLASLGLGWIGEPALAQLIEGAFRALPGPLDIVATHAVAVGVAFAIITVLHIVLGELVPKTVALLFPERISEWAAFPMVGFTWVMAGPIALLNGAARALLRLMRIRAPSTKERLHSPEEIRMLVGQSQEGGRLDLDDARLLEGVFEFSEKTAEEVMTPRTQMTVVAAEDTVEQAADRIASAGRSRYPVIGESQDDVVGVVHAKDVLAALRRSPGVPVRTIMRAPLFVPGAREVEDVLADMKRLKNHLALVLDEYGGTAGLVTMEDLLEEIVGPIYDEHDAPAVAPVPTTGGPVVDGSLPIGEFNQQFGVELDDSDYSTIGGYLFGQLGRLPTVGDPIETDGFRFEIVAMDGRRVGSLRVLTRPAPPTP
ncbi:MAG: hemolysin family protein [Gemmatimonadota bacterium]